MTRPNVARRALRALTRVRNSTPGQVRQGRALLLNKEWTALDDFLRSLPFACFIHVESALLAMRIRMLAGDDCALTLFYSMMDTDYEALNFDVWMLRLQLVAESILAILFAILFFHALLG